MTPNLPMKVEFKPFLKLMSDYGSYGSVLKFQQSMLDLLLFGICYLPPEDKRATALFNTMKEKMHEIKAFKEEEYE